MPDTPRARLFAALLLGTLVLPVAHAGEVEKAEHTRLSEEMRKHAQRNAWTAVEANFVRIEELAQKGETISFKDYMLGAEAARALGIASSCRKRLAAAIALDPKKEALDWIADIDANYGGAKITFDDKYEGPRGLTAAAPPFAPDQRMALEYATARIAAGEDFEGLLPSGEYTVGDKKLTVPVGPEKVAALSFGPPEKEAFQLAYVGPRGTIGVAYTAAGGLNESGLASEAGPQPSAFGGGGARFGVGVEVGITERVGVIGEVGYHNLFGATGVEEVPAYVVAGDSVHLGYGWLAGSLRFGDLWLAAGPVWGAGRGKATGVEGSCEATEAECYQRLAGSIYAGGAAGSVSWALMDISKLKGAITLEGGAQSDTYRWFPWGQVGLTVAPAGRVADGSRRTE